MCHNTVLLFFCYPASPPYLPTSRVAPLAVGTQLFEALVGRINATFAPKATDIFVAVLDLPGTYSQRIYFTTGCVRH
jgi:hypothetical protein